MRSEDEWIKEHIHQNAFEWVKSWKFFNHFVPKLDYKIISFNCIDVNLFKNNIWARPPAAHKLWCVVLNNDERTPYFIEYLPLRWYSNSKLVSHTHTHTIDVIVDVRMTSCDVIVGIGMTSLPVYGHTECDTRLMFITHFCQKLKRRQSKCVSRTEWHRKLTELYRGYLNEHKRGNQSATTPQLATLQQQ